MAKVVQIKHERKMPSKEVMDNWKIDLLNTIEAALIEKKAEPIKNLNSAHLTASAMSKGLTLLTQSNQYESVVNSKSRD